MFKKRGSIGWLAIIAIVSCLPGVVQGADEAASGAKLMLKEGWAIQSSANIQEEGNVVSTADFKPQDWYPTQVPSTVLAALVNDHVYPDPYFGMNLRSIPGTTYPIAQNFSRTEMPPESPFLHPWWYRTAFELPAAYRGKTVWLHFDGINYRANIWLNGKQIADSKQVAGAYRLYEFNVTDFVRPGETNVLAVEVSAPHPNDLAITWVDWSPMPPDKDMGLWHDVYITTSGPVALRYPFVATQFDLPSLETAHLTVSAELHNATQKAVKGTLKGEIEDIRFSQAVELGPGETKVVTFAPEQFPQLNLKQPRVWWPAKLGPQNLYDLKMEFETDGAISDAQTVRFGVRQITTKMNEQNYRIFQINGKNILIRGGGWAMDMMMRPDPQRQEAEMHYVLDMNLNTIRLEGKLEDENFLRLADDLGILLMPGWCCCAHWERWRDWSEEDYPIAAESLKNQVERLRSHPSVFTWLYGSDNPPPPKVEEMYIKVLKDNLWPNPSQSSATEDETTVTGLSGLKMRGPYEYVAPSYWLTDTKNGGAFSFNTETGPGPAVPPVESLREMLPASHLWPIDEYWDYHAGGGRYRNVDVFTEALEARFGKAKGLEDYAMKAQVLAYESHRAMFEAFGRNKYLGTGVIQWMLNNAWPSLIWHLYDYYLRPGGSYFGTKKACEPLHIQYSYDDRSIVVVNSFYQPHNQLKATAKVYNLDMTEKFSKEATLDAGPDSSNRVFVIPEIEGLSTTYFLRLSLEDSTGKPVSSNLYWLSTKPETLDWEKSTGAYTPTKTFADLTELQSLPKVKLNVASSFETRGEEGVAHVSLENPTKSLAFAVHLKVTRGPGGEEILPILWEDNYFALFPGEKRVITATYSTKPLGRAQGPYGRRRMRSEPPVVTVDGWNVVPE
jgi:exo-1,4-beta-D-glucosaminidase